MNDLSILHDLDAMSEITRRLNKPWLVAVWPGMGQVAISAGYYLMAKLGMDVLAEFSPRELFEVDHVEVKNGLIHAARLPRSRCFVWIDPGKHHDIVLFIGEAQPTGRLAFCQALIRFATHLGVERIFTFAAMATRMHPEHKSRVFVAATDQATLDELSNHEFEVLEEGHIGGLNGVVLGEAAAAGLPGACLLGEIPHIFSQLPFPGASLSVLSAFADLAGITIDLDELQEQADVVAERLGEFLSKAEEEIQAKLTPESPEEDSDVDLEPEQGPTPEDRRRIDELFAQARADRSKAYELKQELDRLGAFAEYEDQFLDLFQKPQ